MPRLPVRFASLLAILAGSVFGTQTADACSVPVYRYALERWPSDPYRVVVFHRGPLSKSHKALVEDLGPYGLAGEKHANLVVKSVDLDGQPDPELLKLWKTQNNATLPHMVVGYPAVVNYGPAWSGPLTEQAVTTLIDSPARRELAKRVLAGQTAIWILLESGDKTADDAAYATLKKQLAIEEKKLKLPEIDANDLLGGEAAKEVSKLRIEFSIIRVSRKDPKERMLAEMLLGSEGSGKDSLRDKDFINKVMVFPIFGRGRIRYGLVGSGIAADTIHEACAYLCGPCKCQIKQGVENRGMDLVMAVDWRRLVLSTIKDKPTPPLTGVGGLRPLKIETPPQQLPPVVALVPRRRTANVANPPTQKVGAQKKSAAKTQAGNGNSPNVRRGKEAPQPAGKEGVAVKKNEDETVASTTPVNEADATPLYRNVFLIFGLVAFVVVLMSVLLARRNA